MTLMPRAVIFDWDNTLVDSWGTIHIALSHMFEAMGQSPWSLDETKQRVRQSLRDAFPALFGDRWQEARAIYLARFEAIHLETLTPLAGAADLLAFLRDHGIYCAIVSNKTGRLLRREVAALGWEDHFSAVIGAGDAVRDKPDPAPVGLALEKSGFVPDERVWFVGDTGIDVACARQAGCYAVLIAQAQSFAEDPEYATYTPQLILPDCITLRECLTGLG